MNLKASSLFSVGGKTVVITGASGFLGRVMSETMLENGARVVALGRSQAFLAMAEGWKQTYGSEAVHPHVVEMRDHVALTRLLDQIAAGQQVEVVINNAHELSAQTGFNVPEGALERSTLEQLAGSIEGGLFWPALILQRLGPSMLARGRGSIINIASMYASVAPSPQLYEGTRFFNPPGYSAAKAALVALTRYAASFWGPQGIRANAILPGPFSNVGPGPGQVPESDEFIQRLRDRTCLGRIGSPEELAGALLFLASDASSFVTGHSLTVDGGWTII